MGMLVDGRWTDEDRTIAGGVFVRAASVYWGDVGGAAAAALWVEPGRFHLIASASCPWSHFATIVWQLKGLADTVPLHIAGGARVEGYPVNGGAPWRVPGTDKRIVHVHELYALSDPDYTGRATVPVLWDSRTRRIVSNESVAIARGVRWGGRSQRQPRFHNAAGGSGRRDRRPQRADPRRSGQCRLSSRLGAASGCLR